jgi:hypothetical protein
VDAYAKRHLLFNAGPSPPTGSIVANRPNPTGDTNAMLNKIATVLPGIFIEGRRYKKAGVIFFGLESTDTVQPDIFGYAEITQS